jgi:lipopolysaccharide biosynthesis protein
VYVVPEALAPFLERVDGMPADIVGATDTLMFRYHLQSYFLRLGSAALASEFVDQFLESYVPVADKHYVINAYEIGFSRRAAELGLALDAVYPYEELVAGRNLSGSELAPNPTLELWDVLLEQGAPFVKRQLLRDMKPDPARLRELVPAETLRLAEAHLTRVSGRASVDTAAGERS